MTKENRTTGNYDYGRKNNLPKHTIGTIVCLLMSFLPLSAQDFDVQFVGEISLLSLDDEIFINTSKLKSCAAIVISSSKTLMVEADTEIVDVDNFWNRPESVIYVLPSTGSLTIGYKDLTPLCYEIPIQLEIGKLYSLEVKIIDKSRLHNKKLYALSSPDIGLSGFKLNPTVLIGSLEPVYDNSGNACAVIRYFVNDENFVVEPNLGVLKTVTESGRIIQYVPVGTKRLTVRNGNFMPLNGYELPVDLVSKTTYDVNVSLLESAIKRKKASPDHDNYLGVGYNGTMLFSANGGHHIFSIHCNGNWEITAPPWCVLSNTAGYGNMEIKIKARVNFEENRRSGLIIIRSGDVTSTINVEQK